MAVAAINHALGVDVGGESHGGEKASQALVAPAAAALSVLPESAGDGAASGTATAINTAGLEDVVLWRDEHGIAHATVPHIAKHSHGLEWGYGGSGPADLALSVLLTFADEATAEALYVRFKEVVARLPYEGGVLRARDVRRWIEHASRTGDRTA